MDPVPEDPDAFFTSYLPARFAGAADRLGVTSSVGSVTARVVGVGEWSMRLKDGELEVVRGTEDDVMLQITASLEDFMVLVKAPLEHLGTEGRIPAVRAGPLRALAANAETARLVRHVPGSVMFVARDGDAAHRLLLTPGRRAADLAHAECTIDCKLDDLKAAQAGGMTPMQLFVSGKLRITGNVQIAMALAGILT
ncbi:MAG TPA: SCP2 sterol-binding domain-containing protein [Polyangiaceae bacterium]|jgi:hypothetical protein|nr:SCP2 sterol-binding domain-containing protein [Polyangiaceae bacterium]